MNKRRLLLALLLLPLAAWGQGQTVDGRTIRAGTIPLTADAPQTANTVVGNCTSASASPTACTATQAKASLAITSSDVSNASSLTGTTVTDALNSAGSPLSTAVPFETTNVSSSLQRQRAGFAAVSSKVAQAQRIVATPDSLSEGTGTPTSSYADVAFAHLGAKQWNTGAWARMWTPGLSNLNECTDVYTGSFGVAPRMYSFDSYGLVCNASDGLGSWKLLPQISAGVQRSWNKARVFYLQHPAGVQSITIIGGGNYGSTPTAVIDAPPAAVQATGTVALTGGFAVGTHTLTNAGHYADTPACAYSAAPSGGTTATCKTVMGTGGAAGTVTGWYDTNAGSYPTGPAPTVTFGTPAAVVQAQCTPVLTGTAVTSCTMTTVGQGYETAPNVTFGSGTSTATGTAVLGNSFNLQQWSSDASSGPVLAVNATGPLQLSSADLPVSLTTTSPYVQAVNITGSVEFMGTLLLQNDVTTDAFTIRASQPGSTAAQWATQDQSMYAQWYTALNIDLTFMNEGTNDQVSQTAAQFQQSLTTNIVMAQAASNAPAILVIEPQQTSQWATSNGINYPQVYRSVATTMRTGFYSVQDRIGNYAFIAEQVPNGCCGYNETVAPFIHPNYQTNQAIGKDIANLVGAVTPNDAPFVFAFGQPTPQINPAGQTGRGFVNLSVGAGNPIGPFHVQTQAYFSNNTGAALLAGGMTTTDTSFTLQSSSGYSVYGGLYHIDSEFLYCLIRSGLTINFCTRGALGTTAAIHNTNGAVVVPEVAVVQSLTQAPVLLVENQKIVFNRAGACNGTGACALQWTAPGVGTCDSVIYGISGNATGDFSQATNQDKSTCVNSVLVTAALSASSNKGFATYGPFVARSLDRQSFSAAGSYQALSTSQITQNRNATTIATFTLTTPAAPIDQQEWDFTSRGQITSLTLTPSAGQTVDALPTTIPAGSMYRMIYDSAATNWDRIQ